MTRQHATRLAAALLAVAATGAAAEPRVYRLNPGEIARLQAEVPPPIDAFDALPPPRDKQVHGEVGAFVGTGGARGAFGSAMVPLGETGTAAFAFETSRFGDGRARRRY